MRYYPRRRPAAPVLSAVDGLRSSVRRRSPSVIGTPPAGTRRAAVISSPISGVSAVVISAGRDCRTHCRLTGGGKLVASVVILIAPEQSFCAPGQCESVSNREAHTRQGGSFSIACSGLAACSDAS